jgi:hypothetical protein|tara:strand:+ start:389 stop:607 length:219 start_codon:yes stop_codon:yes gene_type:complete
MQIQDDIKTLHNYEAFARFIKLIHNLREEAIEELHEASIETIQQVSGRIITYDQVLQLVNWEELVKRHSDYM